MKHHKKLGLPISKSNLPLTIPFNLLTSCHSHQTPPQLITIYKSLGGKRGI